ncbi:UDP-N-acetylmuramyl pentapeptide phosphotransferase/UDP-N-acetylglucosamine-1-phosphate transferase [Stackebrandtia soli]
MGFLSRNARKLLIVGAGAVAARAAMKAISSTSAASTLERRNHHGGIVSLKEGPAAAIGATTGAVIGARRPSEAAAAAIAGLGSGAVGLYDDVVGARPEHTAKGLRGHLLALTEGRVTSGALKVLGAGLSGLAAAALIDADGGREVRGGKIGRVTHTMLGAGVIAGMANLMNLFDLRPGRALKVATAVTGPLSGRDDASGRIALGTMGAASALLPEDLSEETMLGDCGANALGALMGLSLAARSGPVVRGALLAGITALTLTSEKVSFTQVIADTPVLRHLDEFGRKSPNR